MLFRSDLITIFLENNLKEAALPFVKAVFQCGNIQRVIDNPIFPLNISFSKTESLKLQQTNVCYLAVIDSNNHKYTCEGSLTFQTRGEVVDYE